jgi:glycerate dehydrogenase
MKIVILDGYTVSQDDLSWSILDELAEIEVYDRTSAEDVVKRCKDAEMVLTNKVVLDSFTLNQLPRLMYIGVLATGYNVVDLEAAEKQNIVVTNIPAYSTKSVAQMVFSHLLNIVSMVGKYAERNREGEWTRSEDFCYLRHNLFELSRKRFGIVGLGNIGMEVAKIANAFDMEVFAYTSKTGELPYGIRRVSIDELFTSSDVISLHCPLNEETHHMVDAKRLKSMKPSAILINTGRGPLVKDDELAEALNANVIAAYGADVMTVEPPEANNQLLKAKNCYLTPHIAWATRDARQRLMHICRDNIKAFLDGKPVNVVGRR